MLGAVQVACAVLSVLLMVLVLAHKGSGGGLSDMFGGGASELRSSATAPATLTRSTVVCALLWAATVLAVGAMVA